MKLGALSRTAAQTKAMVMAIVAQTKQRSDWSVKRTLRALGIARSVYYGWVKRGRLEDRVGSAYRGHEVLAQEREAICAFALNYPKIGYRKLTWMMIDQNVACVGESTVYRVLSEADLLSRWKRSERSERSKGEYAFRPTAPNEQWHSDVMYVWVGARYYFLLSFIDAYSRYLVHHKLLTRLDGQAVALELQAALEGAGGIQPRIVHDHGPEFVNKDVASVIKENQLLQIKTRRRHPESNGIVERFNGTVRDETDDVYGEHYLQAQDRIATLVRYYNEERLHAAIGYMTPKTWHHGGQQALKAERARKIAAARAHRKTINQQRQLQAA